MAPGRGYRRRSSSLSDSSESEYSLDELDAVDPVRLRLHADSPQPVCSHQLHAPNCPQGAKLNFPGPAHYAPQEPARQPPPGVTVNAAPRWRDEARIRELLPPSRQQPAASPEPPPASGRRHTAPAVVVVPGCPSGRCARRLHSPPAQRPSSAEFGTLALSERFAPADTPGPGPAGCYPSTRLVQRSAKGVRMRADSAAPVRFVTLRGLRGTELANADDAGEALARELGVTLQGSKVVGVAGGGAAQHAGVADRAAGRDGDPAASPTGSAWEVHAVNGVPVARQRADDQVKKRPPSRFRVTLRLGCGMSAASLPRVRRRRVARVVVVACTGVTAAAALCAQAMGEMHALLGMRVDTPAAASCSTSASSSPLLQTPVDEGLDGQHRVAALQAVRAVRRLHVTGTIAATQRRRGELRAAMLLAARLRCNLSAVVEWMANSDTCAAVLRDIAGNVRAPCGGRYATVRRRDLEARRHSEAGGVPPLHPLPCTEGLPGCTAATSGGGVVQRRALGWTCAQGCHWSCQRCVLQHLALPPPPPSAPAAGAPDPAAAAEAPPSPARAPPVWRARQDWKGGRVVGGKRRYGGPMDPAAPCSFGARRARPGMPEPGRSSRPPRGGQHFPGPGHYEVSEAQTRPNARAALVPLVGHISTFGVARAGQSPCAYTPCVSQTMARSCSPVLYCTA
eukprot:TRINITY_DN7503_c3_g1_i1.p1 TRINITY_DN7503_c3_g1~~TRINITY_DN7503_c3_g1_i1.p1  ORF type:complete len:707 (+),score=166.89 TRINITY_DN7503_c3_g1_i1:79-2121(+)